MVLRLWSNEFWYKYYLKIFEFFQIVWGIWNCNMQVYFLMKDWGKFIFGQEDPKDWGKLKAFLLLREK